MRKKAQIVLGILTVAVVLGSAILFGPEAVHYLNGRRAFSNENYAEAVKEYGLAGDFFDAQEQQKNAISAQWYWEGEVEISVGDYESAAKCFVAAGDYLDAPTRVKESYYTLGEHLMPKGRGNGWGLKTFQAAKAFASAGDYRDSRERILESAMTLLKQREYRHAENTFAFLSDPDSMAYWHFCRGMQRWERRDYAGAIEAFEEAKKDAPERAVYVMDEDKTVTIEHMINAGKLIEAEKYFNSGELGTAEREYAQIPRDFTYGGISVAERMVFFEENRAVVDLCGKWKVDTIYPPIYPDKIVVKQISKDNRNDWKSWTRESASNYGKACILDIRCIPNALGVSMQIEAEMTFYSKWEDISADLKTEDVTVITSVYLPENEIPNSTESGFSGLGALSSVIMNGNTDLRIPLDEYIPVEISYDGTAFCVETSFVIDNYHIDYDYEFSSCLYYSVKMSSH